MILRIKQLLYSEGFTIAGAKKKLEVEGDEPAAAPPARASSETAKVLRNVREELTAILKMLDDQ